jgi:hypothetical protein
LGESFVSLVLSELRFFFPIPRGYHFADAEKHLKKDGKRLRFDAVKKIYALEAELEMHNNDVYSAELAIDDIIDSRFRVIGLAHVPNTSDEVGYWDNIYESFNGLWNNFVRNSGDPKRTFEQNRAFIELSFAREFGRADQGNMLWLGNRGMGRGSQEQRDGMSEAIHQLVTDQVILEALCRFGNLPIGVRREGECNKRVRANDNHGDNRRGLLDEV